MGELSNGKEAGAVETMMAQLQSVNIEDKVCGCHALSRHYSNPSFVSAALHAQVARATAPFLLENDPVLRLAAVGALKNLSSHHPDTAEGLVGQDMMTPLSLFLTSLPSNWSPNNSNSKEDPLTSALVQALDLLWNLVEASPTALQMFNERGLVEVVSRLASPHLHNPSLLQAALSCLASATDSNPPAIEALQGRREDFLELCSSGPSLLARATASILLIHLHGNAIFSSPPAFSAIIEVASLALSSNPCSTLASVAKIGGDQDDEGMEVENGGGDGREEAGVKVAHDILAAQQQANSAQSRRVESSSISTPRTLNRFLTFTPGWELQAAEQTLFKLWGKLLVLLPLLLGIPLVRRCWRDFQTGCWRPVLKTNL